LNLRSDELRSRVFEKILLIKLSAVGDVVHTIPVLNKLRRRYPNPQIDWLVTPAIGELLRHHPAITSVIDFRRRAAPSAPWSSSPIASYVRLAAALRATGYDLVIDMHGQLRTAVLALATGAPVRIGFDRPRAKVWDASPREIPEQARKHAWQGAREGSWLAYTNVIPIPTLEMHAVDRYLNIASLLDLEEGAPDFSFPISQQASRRVGGLLDYHGVANAELIVMAPGTIWETKQWLSGRFAEVARHFLRNDLSVVLIGTDRERAACAKVAELAPGVIDLSGETTLSELAALIRRATICVTNDSGPMHLAVALNRPVVSVFGSTNPTWIGPYRREGAVLQANAPCSPCYLRQLSRCTNGHSCMNGVDADAVIDRIEATLQQRVGAKIRSKALANST
jgi:heptosyltransferase I